MTLAVDRPDELERRLRKRASRHGRAVEEYVLGLVERDAAGPEDGPGAMATGLDSGQAPALPDGAFETLLDELAAGPTRPHRPADFSRADLYAEHHGCSSSSIRGLLRSDRTGLIPPGADGHRD